MEVLLILIPVILLGIVFRLMAGGMDNDRIRMYIEGRGGRFLNAEWKIIGPGWAGEKNDRIYQVSYIDSEGNERLAYCKTSMWSGVYFTRDEITTPATPPPSKPTASDLEEENRRLREELERHRLAERETPKPEGPET